MNFIFFQTDWEENYKKLSVNMEQYYEKDGYTLYNPIPGMLCAFKLEEDGVTLWLRGQIMEVNVGRTKTRTTGGSCLIFGFDIGQMCEVDWESIKELNIDFQCEKPFVARCVMADVKPFKEHNYQWTQEAKKYFSELCYKRQNFKLEVVDIPENQENIYVSLFFEDQRLNGSTTCVNALLVQHGHALSSGIESETIIVQKPGTSANTSIVNYKSLSKKRNVRCRIEVLEAISPGEMYIRNLQAKEEALVEFQQLIQTEMEEKVDNESFDWVWKIGDRCLVYTKWGHTNEWYRAEITKKLPENKYHVRLLDFRKDVDIDLLNMSRIPNKNILTAAPHVIKCHLACAEPLNSTGWSKTTIDVLLNQINKSRQLSATIQGQYDRVQRSLPIVLWSKEPSVAEALAPSLTQYTNINNMMGQYGYFRLTGSFEKLSDHTPEIEKVLELAYIEEVQKIVNATEAESNNADETLYLDESCEYVVTAEETPIKKWKPSIPNEKSMFSGEGKLIIGIFRKF